MVKASEIHDRISLRAWLRHRSPADATEIALRTSMRVFPIFARKTKNKTEGKIETTALGVLRALLTSRVACHFSTPEVQIALLGAFRAIDLISQTVVNHHGLDTYNAYSAAQAAAKTSLSLGENYLSDAVDAISHSARAASSYGFDAGRTTIWQGIRNDAARLEVGESLSDIRLWLVDPPIWFISANDDRLHLWREGQLSDWGFWEKWWAAIVAGDPLSWDLQRDIALIPDDVWEAGPKAVAAAIAAIEVRYERLAEAPPTLLSQAFIYDFVVDNERLRMTGVALDFEGRTDQDIENCLKGLRDWKNELVDWTDCLCDLPTLQNEPSALQRAAQKLITLIDTIDSPRDFPARRLVSLGGDLRLLGIDASERGKVGDTLGLMLDSRIDELSHILGHCFGHVLHKLQPLHDLELGPHAPSTLIEGLDRFIEELRQVSSADLMQMDQTALAVVKEAYRELKAIEVAISKETNAKYKEYLNGRFATKYGEVSTTLGRAVEKGREFGTNVTSRFDTVVKWIKRWESIEGIIDWFDKFPPS
ncbi:MAG: hypothetical protein ACEQSU_17115 [Microgenomates group bacterium]